MAAAMFFPHIQNKITFVEVCRTTKLCSLYKPYVFFFYDVYCTESTLRVRINWRMYCEFQTFVFVSVAIIQGMRFDHLHERLPTSSNIYLQIPFSHLSFKFYSPGIK